MNCAKFRLINLCQVWIVTAVLLAVCGMAYGRDLPPLPARPRRSAAISRVVPSDGRDIVFAAAYYRKSGRFYLDDDRYSSHGKPVNETVDFVSQSLYTVRPDGTGLRRLTSHDLLCESPKRSPDGRNIVFVGSSPNSYRHIYVVNSDGHGLRRLTSGNWEDTKPEWSPNGGREILFCRSTPKGYTAHGHSGNISLVVVRSTGSSLAYSSQRIIAVSPAKCEEPTFADWSSDGGSIMASFEAESTDDGFKSYEIDVHSGRQTEIKSTEPAHYSRRIYVNGSQEGDYIQGTRLYTVASDGRVLYSRPLKPEPWKEATCNVSAKAEMASLDVGEGGALEFPTTTSQYGLLCAGEGRSDGRYYRCYRIDPKRATYRLLCFGQSFGFAPTGSRFLVSDDEWVGPYKRGGQRLGPLEIVNLRTGRLTPLSRRLASVDSADWRTRRPQRR